jgi:hypothetical protein
VCVCVCVCVFLAVFELPDLWSQGPQGLAKARQQLPKITLSIDLYIHTSLQACTTPRASLRLGVCFYTNIITLGQDMDVTRTRLIHQLRKGMQVRTCCASA